MGLLAVIGPSMKDHRGAPARSSFNLRKASVRVQNSSISCSSSTKSTCVLTGLNAIFYLLHFRAKLQLRPMPGIQNAPAHSGTGACAFQRALSRYHPACPASRGTARSMANTTVLWVTGCSPGPVYLSRRPSVGARSAGSSGGIFSTTFAVRLSPSRTR